MVRRSRYDEVLWLGKLSLIPFAIAAIGVWILPHTLALGVHRIILAYSVVLGAYLAGVGAGGILGGAVKSAEPLAPGFIAVLAAWCALWLATGSVFYVAPVWRYVLVIGVWIYLLLRDLQAVDQRQLPAWYGPLRMRMTFWVVTALALIAARLALWGHF